MDWLACAPLIAMKKTGSIIDGGCAVPFTQLVPHRPSVVVAGRAGEGGLVARQRRTGDPDLLHLRKGHCTNNARERINSAMTQHCSNCSRNTVATFLVIDLNFKFLINRWISLLMLIHCRSFILNPSMQRRIPIQHVGGGEHALPNNWCVLCCLHLTYEPTGASKPSIGITTPQ